MANGTSEPWLVALDANGAWLCEHVGECGSVAAPTTLFVAGARVENELEADDRKRRTLQCPDCGTHWRIWEQMGAAKWYAANPVCYGKLSAGREPFRFRHAPCLDIDRIITALAKTMPDLLVAQWCQSWPHDDDGLWIFDLASDPSERYDSRAPTKSIQIESSTGQIPFLVETDELCCEKARNIGSIEGVVSIILDYMSKQSTSPRPAR
jgi:hypothetical protein